MKKILLISNTVMHYRSNIYNEFYKMFLAIGYEFHVISNNYQHVGFEIIYKKHVLPFSVIKYARFINQLKPDVCINFLHLKDRMIIPLTIYCKWQGIPMIYWNHGINLRTPNNLFKNIIFHFIHHISSAIILYSDQQLKYIKNSDLKKTFIAWNTLNFTRESKEKVAPPIDVKLKYGIKEKYVLLYISRILPYKGLDILLNAFKDVDNLGLVIVGGGLNIEQKKIIDAYSHYYYLGEKYGKDVDEIYNMGDIFSTPGHIGLAVNQAMYWGKPVIVLNRKHAPEICYLENGVNGWIVENPIELKNKVLELISNRDLLFKASKAARKTYEERMKLDNMFKGFHMAINYVSKTIK